jgi:hypothetical protein
MGLGPGQADVVVSVTWRGASGAPSLHRRALDCDEPPFARLRLPLQLRNVGPPGAATCAAPSPPRHRCTTQVRRRHSAGAATARAAPARNLIAGLAGDVHPVIAMPPQFAATVESIVDTADDEYRQRTCPNPSAWTLKAAAAVWLPIPAGAVVRARVPGDVVSALWICTRDESPMYHPRLQNQVRTCAPTQDWGSPRSSSSQSSRPSMSRQHHHGSANGHHCPMSLADIWYFVRLTAVSTG